MDAIKFDREWGQATGGKFPSEPFWKYLQLLIKWNQKINLTAITDPRTILEEHFFDSLIPLPFLKNCRTLLDVGSGAGFPGIPIKMTRPDLDLTLVESIKKKVDFMKEVVRELHLESVHVVNDRLVPNLEIGRFDAIVSRGTMALDKFVLLASNFLNTGGRIITFKGKNTDEELEEAKPIIKNLGKKISVESYRLPFSHKERSLIVVM